MHEARSVQDSIERLRSSFVDWSAAAMAVARSDFGAQNLAPPSAADMQSAGRSALRLSSDMIAGLRSFNSWYDIPRGRESVKFATSPGALVEIGLRAMVYHVLAQVVSVASMYSPDREWRAAVPRDLDVSWKRYAMLQGPVDEHTSLRQRWRPRDVANYVVMASAVLDVDQPLVDRWYKGAQEVLALQGSAASS